MPVKLTFPKIKLPACKSNPLVTLRNEAPPFSCEEMGKMKKASELKLLQETIHWKDPYSKTA